MAEHVATTTQQQHPARASWRTAVQSALGFIVALAVVVPLVLAAMDETLGELIPPKVRGVILAVGAVAVAVSKFAARVMAIPVVDRWLKRIGLSSSPTA